MAKSESIRLFKYAFVCLLPFLIIRCANQMAPGGGEVDKIPPEIIDIYPEVGTTNFADNYFEITFSEYVDKRSVQDAIFISPAIEGKLDYDWSGKTLEVSFEDTLRANTTYSVTIGSDVVDHNNRNRMAESFILIFSTGEKIDNGIIEGMVYDEEPAGVMVFAYRKSDSLFNPAEVKPDYVSQVGENGHYKIMGLAEDEYRILAVRDEYRDFIYNIEQDQFGSPYTDVLLTESDSIFSNLNFFLAIEDTTPPHLQSAVMTDENHILIEFNEGIDSTLLSAGSFNVVDSSLNKEYKPVFFFKGQGKPNQFFLSVKDSLSDENEIYLICNGFYDMHKNNNPSETTGLIVSDKPDTLHVKMLRNETEYSNNVVDFENPYLVFRYDDGFDAAQIPFAVKVLDESKNEIPYKLKSFDDSAFRIDIVGKLKPKTDYSVTVDLNYLNDAAGNTLDSLFTYEFKTINDLDFTGISGRIINGSGISISDSGSVMIVLQNVDEKSLLYKDKTKDNKFDFKKIIPGKYLAWSFIDNNANEKYDHGSVYPYQSSEQFVFYPDTINARARWPVGDVLIDYNFVDKHLPKP